MPGHNPHSEVVSAWRDGWAGQLSQQELVDVFERALDAIWRRAHLSLGEVTLMAIVDRVLHQGVEAYPHLAPLEVKPSGARFGALREAAPEVAVAPLEESLVFLVVELLRVFGALTGEILTPGLHAELRKVRAGPVDQRGGKA